MKLTIKIEGEDWGDLELALSEVTKAISAEYVSGADSNNTGSYSFQVDLEEG